MPTPGSKPPAYRLHCKKHAVTHPPGRAIVKLRGKVHYLGQYGSRESWAEYHRLIAVYLAEQNEPPRLPAEEFTITNLVAAWRRHAVIHYSKDGQQTGEVGNFDEACKPLVFKFRELLASDFGPLKLQEVRELMVNGWTNENGKVIAGLSRGVVNSRTNRIRRIFKWAISQELCPASVLEALKSVAPLLEGRSNAREMPPVLPVRDCDVEATLPFLPEVVADMVRFQRLTACRPGEVRSLRGIDIDRSSDPWAYRPRRHKTQHFGRERLILIGPRAQQILLPYLSPQTAQQPLLPYLAGEAADDSFKMRDPEAYCFTPAESERKRKARMRSHRKTRVQPSQENRAKDCPKAKLKAGYGKNSYANAIRRACDLADEAAHVEDPSVPREQRIIPRWAPNQLRHAAATEIRKRFGLEASQVVLGHSSADVTQIYAETDRARAVEIIRQIG
jgi:integrase